jgi:5'-nucleotidase
VKDITDFVPWLVGASGPELAVIRAVTGYDDIPIDGFSFPADGSEFGRVVDLVEKHNLFPFLSVVAALDRQWWRIVANWGLLVGLLDAAEPEWRNGAATSPEKVNAEIDRLYARPTTPRRVLLDMDGPCSDFDVAAFEWCTTNDVTLNIDAPGDQRHRYITDHIDDDDQRAALRAAIDAPGWYRNLPVTPGAQEGVERLLSAGHEIVVCSKPHDDAPHCVAEKLAWIHEHFPMLDHYVFTRDKSLAYGGTQGILLDDCIVHDEVGRCSWEPVVFTAPWNGPGSEWGRYPHWSWSDPIERLTW